MELFINKKNKTHIYMQSQVYKKIWQYEFYNIIDAIFISW